MTSKIEPDVKLPAGDTRNIQFRIRRQDGEDFDLEGSDITWKLQDTRTRDKVLSLDDEGVSIVNRDDSNGKFEVRLNKTVTSELMPTDYREVLQIDDENDDRSTWIGKLLILEDG